MIQNGPLKRNDARAVSVAVTHVLAIGITTILIVGLLTAAGGMANDEQDQSAREQLQMIGNSMANQIEQADQLGRRGANVSVREEFEGTVSGKSYTVDLETDDRCDGATINTSTCLILNLSNSDISTTVGVYNKSPMSFDHKGSGTVKIVSKPGGAYGDAPYAPTIMEQIGVGGTVYEISPGAGKFVGVDKPPIARFSVNPESPQYWDIVVFNASESSDPEGNISKYIWNFTGFTGEGDPNPGRFNRTSEDPTYAIPTGEYSKLDMNPLDAGRYHVKLTVVDSAGQKATATALVKVSGLVYGGNAQARDYNGDNEPGGLFLNLVNKHSSEVTVTEVYINPDDDDIRYIYEVMDRWNDGSYLYPHEILINSTNQAGKVERGDYSYNDLVIHDGGRVIESYEWDEKAHIAEDGVSGYKPNVHFIEFYDEDGKVVDMTGKSGELAFRYSIGSGSDKVYYSTQFNFTADSPYPKGLNPSTYAQNWEAGQKHTAFPQFDNIDKTDDATAKVIDASGQLKNYDWDDKTNKSYFEVTKLDNKGKVHVEGNLKDVSISKTEYIIVEVTVENDHGTKTKRLYIEVEP